MTSLLDQVRHNGNTAEDRVRPAASAGCGDRSDPWRPREGAPLVTGRGVVRCTRRADDGAEMIAVRRPNRDGSAAPVFADVWTEFDMLAGRVGRPAAFSGRVSSPVLIIHATPSISAANPRDQLLAGSFSGVQYTISC